MRSRLRFLRTNLLLGALVTCGLAGSQARASFPGGWTYVDADGTAHAFAQADDCDNNVTDGGAIGDDAQGCPNPTYQPAAITNVTLPSGGSGDIEYAWMTTTTDPASAGTVDWTLIPNTNSPDYTPSPLTQTAYFMRCARRAGCAAYAGETNYVTITLDCCDNVTAGGTIGGDGEACGTPYDPGVLRNLGPATGGSNATEYQWYVSTTSDAYAVGDAAWAPIAGATAATHNPEPISTVTHYVRTAKKEGCVDVGAFSNVVTVAARPLPTVSGTTDDPSCNGQADGSIAAVVDEAAEPFTVRWLDDATTDLARSGLPEGSYTLEVTDAFGCVGTQTFELVAPESLTVAAMAEFDECAFADDAVLTAVATGGTEPYSYAWSNGATADVVTGQPAGSYDVAVADANGCTGDARAEVAPPPAFSATVAFADPNCYQPDGTVDVTPAGGTAPYAYAWSHDPALAGGSATGLAGGDYEITVTDANACEAVVTASLDDTPDITIALEVDNVSCDAADDGEIRSTVTGGTAPYSYSWSNGATTPDLTGVGPGTYTLTITDDRGCTRDVSATVSEPALLEASIDVVQPTCREDGGTLTAQMSGGTPPYTFDWGAMGRGGETVLTGMPAGTYELNVTDDNGCVASATATVEDVPLLALTGSAVDATCPNATDGSATVAATGGQPGYAYRWSDPASQTTATASNLAAGTYAVEVTDGRGCAKTFDVEVGNQSTGPQIESDVTDPECNGDASGAIDLTITEGQPAYTFAWRDNGVLSAVTTEDRSGLAAGAYEVTVTDAVGCEDTQTFTITEPETLEIVGAPTTNFLRYFNVSRFAATDGETASSTTGGTEPYTYSWTQGGVEVSTGANGSGLAGGLVTVTVTDANGCTAKHDTTLVEPSLIGDFVWEDENGDGIQDPGEPGLEDVEIRITGRDFNGFPVNFTTFSDATGAYRFDQLPISQTSYSIFMRLPNEDDYLYSPADQGADDTVDSDFDPVLRRILRAVTASGSSDYTTDAGFIPRDNTITIGDRAWYDADHDGLQDTYELSVQGVTFSLYRVVDGLLVDQTVSDEDGEYIFEDVVPGEYYVEADQFSSSIARDFIVTEANVGGNEAIESDFDPVTQRTGNFVVVSTDADIDNVDLGLHEDCVALADGGSIAGDEDVCVGDLPQPITSATEPASVGRYQWYISDVADYDGPRDPNWNILNGATAPDYQPSSLATTKYYIRLATAAGCTNDFTGTSNVIRKRAIPAPVARIESAFTADGASNTGRTIFMQSDDTLFATAQLVSGVSYFWDFGPDATPRYDTGANAGPITFVYDAADQRSTMELRVVNASGCEDRDRFDVFVLDAFTSGLVDAVVAEADQTGNVVRWTGVSLVDGAHYEVQRATPDAEFETIEQVSALDRGMVDYTRVDRFAPAGELAYRVVLTAPRHDPTESEAVHLVSEREDLLARAYPNPVADELTLEVAAVTTGEVRYELTNAFGALVRAGLIERGRRTFDVRDLPGGTYHLRVVAADGDSAVRTVLKR